MPAERLKFASRMSLLGTETAFEVLARAKALEAQGRSIVHLEIGEPDFDTPRAHQRGRDPGAAGRLHALHAQRRASSRLREAIAEYVGAHPRHRRWSADQVVITPGAKPIMFYVILALVDHGDEVIYPDPGLPDLRVGGAVRRGAARAVAAARGARVPRRSARSCAGACSPRTRLVILNSPAQPDRRRALAPRTSRRSRRWCADGRSPCSPTRSTGGSSTTATFASIASVPGMAAQTVILDGFSKTYAMTGWRLGYGVMEPELARRASRS